LPPGIVMVPARGITGGISNGVPNLGTVVGSSGSPASCAAATGTSNGTPAI
jgi:hypothetical protein